MGIKEAKKVCVQNAIEEFCQEEDNTDTRICKRLRDNDEDWESTRKTIIEICVFMCFLSALPI